MPVLYPLRLTPIFRQYIWGGRRLESALGKSLGPDNDYAESWEVCDHAADQSVVEAGPLAGTTLHQLVKNHGEELLGRHHPQSQFPLLFKFLDAQRTLSVQVHPNDDMAASLAPPDLGKTEAWVVLASEPDSLIYAGLRPGVDRDSLRQAIDSGTCEETLHQFHPEPGDCVFLPAGVVHAIGAGLVVAEIQQASDTTFRLFDWNRTGADGQPRELHVEQGLEAIDFARGPVGAQVPDRTGEPGVERLVQCDKFVWDRWTLDKPRDLQCEESCHILSVISGAVRIAGDAVGHAAEVGQTVLIPAACDAVRLEPIGTCVLLDAHLP